MPLETGNLEYLALAAGLKGVTAYHKPGKQVLEKMQSGMNGKHVKSTCDLSLYIYICT